MKFEDSEFEKLSKEDIYVLLSYFPTNQLVSWLNYKVLGLPVTGFPKSRKTFPDTYENVVTIRNFSQKAATFRNVAAS